MPELRNAEILDPKQPAFWSIWLDHLRQFVEHPSVSRAPTRVVLFARKFCTHYLDNGRLLTFHDEEYVNRLNGYLDAVYHEAELIPSLHVVRPDEITWFSSHKAPYGMSWSHPDAIGYAEVVEKLLPHIFDNQHTAASIRSTIRLEQARRRTEAEATQQQAFDDLKASHDKLVADVDAYRMKAA